MRPGGALTCAAVAEELKGKLGIEPTARAEELLVADFCRIAGSIGLLMRWCAGKVSSHGFLCQFRGLL